jgi:uncharacterized membrane protein (DUF485 family)
MRRNEIDWQAVLASDVLQRIKRERRNTVVTLGIAATIYYFAIPALIAWVPGFFRLHIAPGVNGGLLFVFSQYLFGGAVAWIFIRRTAAVDPVAAELAQRLSLEIHQESKSTSAPVSSVLERFFYDR